MEMGSAENGETSVDLDKKNEPIEDKLEDRYQRLHRVALRLKKKVADQAEEISQLEEIKARLTEKNQTALRIQQEFDLAQDEVEKLKKTESNLQKDLKAALEANIKLKEADFEKSNQIQSLTNSHKLLREKVEKSEATENELSVWKSRAMELESEMKELRQADALQEKRQTAIMTLEITDYEKKLQLAHQDLESSKQEIQSQSSQIEKLEEIVKSLEGKIDSLSANIDQLTSMKENLQTDVERKGEKISFLQEEISKANEKFHEKKTELFQLQSEYENCKLNFASESKVLVEKNSMLHKTISVLEHKISALEENKRSRESLISNQKLEMQQLETEFRNYKVKAQAMLKSQKPAQPAVNQEKDELENLQKIVQDFHSEISILRSDLQTLRLENENLAMEKSELNLKLKQMKTELLEKEVRFNSEIQKLRSDLRLKETELKKIAEEHQLDRDVLVSSYKDQIESLRQNYEAKIRSLKEQLELSKVMSSAEGYGTEAFEKPSPSSDCDTSGNKDKVPEFKTLEREPPFGSTNALLTQNSLERLQQPLTIDTSSNMSFDQLRMIPRGECEGSESASTYLPRADNYNISFEQLLSSSFDSNSKLSSDSDVVQKPDVTQVMKELSRCQSQVKHLTAVLRESESNCERLTQLSEALKEEIRRVERDKERKEHLQENSEYLKNVLLKFVTLSGEDEKLRLIPVFKTMLRLAPDEVTRLENSVRESQTSRDNVGGKGWSSYLQKWTA